MNALLAATVRSGAARPSSPGSQFEELFDGVDDLIKRVADTENPEIRKIRAKVHASMMVAKGAYRESAGQVRSPAAQPAGEIGSKFDEYPGEALGVALLVGVGLGVIMSIQQ